MESCPLQMPRLNNCSNYYIQQSFIQSMIKKTRNTIKINAKNLSQILTYSEPPGGHKILKNTKGQKLQSHQLK